MRLQGVSKEIHETQAVLHWLSVSSLISLMSLLCLCGGDFVSYGVLIRLRPVCMYDTCGRKSRRRRNVKQKAEYCTGVRTVVVRASLEGTDHIPGTSMHILPWTQLLGGSAQR